jgi:predicted MPP superfamily phosphohydrolase
MRVSRRKLLLGLGLAGVAGTSATAYAAAVDTFGLIVTRYRLNPAGWPREHRLTVAVIADLHAGGPNMRQPRVRDVVDRANALGADLTLLLGDYMADHKFVTERVPHAVWGAELARLTAPLGVWAILGNHDWWRGADAVRATLAAARIPVLENDAVRIGTPGRRFWLAGLGDQMAFRLGSRRFRGVDDLPATLRRLRGDDPVILMAHEPDIFPRVPGRIALTLSGHTHGGQIVLPGIGPLVVPSRYGLRYLYGHVAEGDRDLVVSGGIGTSIVPARLGVSPEIVHIELGGEPESA